MKANEPDAQEYELSSRIIAKAGVSRTGQRIKGIEIAFDDDFANPGYAENRIGSGSAGFETFTLDIPDELRGKVSTLRFELEDYEDEVYLDNVFFQSQHLQFGNPTDARIQYDPYPADRLTENHNDNRENFLVEKPQYTISYNDTTKNPNWVSWQLNRSWLGAESRTNKFEQDHTLPSNWDKVQGDKDINGNPDIVPGRPDLSGKFYDRGHLAPSGDRTRNEKDNYATFLMSNMIPQSPLNNRLEEWWLGLENYSRNLVKRGKELYITAGGYNNADDFSSILRSPNGYDIGVPNHLWKVIVVMDQPGQTIADVDEDTMAFAIDIPNIDPDDDAINPNDWKDYVIPVQTLENRLGTTEYDFISNVPTEIQEKIETRDRDDILGWIGDRELTSPLLAAPDTSIRHNSFVENNVLTTFNNQFPDSSQVSITEIGVEKTSFYKDSISKYGSAKIDFTESNLSEPSTSKVDPLHITVPKTTFVHTNPAEVSKAQVNFSEGSLIELGFTEVSFPIDSASDSFAVEASETLSSEILFSPSIESEQFSSIHNSTPKITNVLNNTATNIWSDLLQSETQLDIDFQVTALPTGQLAEATISGFDKNGVPNTGTILIDHDANGVGWFIDRTPLDNSEFIAQDTDSYLLAATESEANAKYDLLTTVLHELAHIYGFIDGYEGFDTNVETENGTTKFIGDDFEAVLDGEHLDKLAHPNDLMNTHLAPGIRKLPSELDVQILQAIQKAEGRGQKADGNLDAALTSDPLFAIANGDFSISDTTTWDTRGASDIEDIQAVLTEDSPFLSNFTQTFVEARADLTIDEGSTVNLSGSFTDAGTEDTHTVAWDLGNGETTIQPMLLLPMPMDIKWSNFLPRCNFGLRSA
ncbi:MAG: DNA/RNA non-specific endonuclease [Cyanobacteria bacterium J06555_3]